MYQTCLTFPILPGRGEMARDFLREIDTSRKTDHARSLHRLGLTKALWFLVDGVGGAQFVVFLEGTDVARALDQLVRSRDTFDLWFKAALADVTGVDLNDPPEGIRPPELLAAYAIEEASGNR